jgi:hypothetical protein
MRLFIDQMNAAVPRQIKKGEPPEEDSPKIVEQQHFHTASRPSAQSQISPRSAQTQTNRRRVPPMSA